MEKKEVVKDYAARYSMLSISNAKYRKHNTLSFEDNQICKSAVLTGPTLTLHEPFTIKVEKKTHSISKISFVHPCPVKIENEEHPAAMLLLSEGFVLIIPLRQDNSGSPSQLFVDRVVHYIGVRPLQSMTLATGRDWSISSIIKKKSAFFMWHEANLNRIVETDTPEKRVLGWEVNTLGGIDYMCLAEPMSVSSVGLTYINRLQVSPNHKILPPVFYTPACRKCDEKNVVPLSHSKQQPGTSTARSWEIAGYIVGALVFIGVILLMIHFNVIPWTKEKLILFMNITLDGISTLTDTIIMNIKKLISMPFAKRNALLTNTITAQVPMAATVQQPPARP
jgi:hypothetical protein